MTQYKSNKAGMGRGFTPTNPKTVSIDEVIKYIRSGEVAGSFSEGCDCEKCDRYEKKVRKALAGAGRSSTHPSKSNSGEVK